MNAPAKQLRTVENELEAMDNDTLHQAMARAFAEIEAATKSADNPFFKSKYADLGAIIGTVKPALVAHGLFFTQHCHPSEDGVIVETQLHHRNGESMSMGQLYVPANKRDPQGFGSAQTYARRYALQTAFGVPVEDDDGNQATRSVATTGEEPPRKVKLTGAYDTLPKLERAAKEFTRTLRSLATFQEYKDWANEDTTKEFVEQLKRDLPGWWFGGDGCPDNLTPLSVEVEQTKRGLKELAEMETR